MKMTETAQPAHELDTRLADFTDRILAGEAAPPIPASDPEMRALEETVIRLHRSFPDAALDQRTRERLYANFGHRVRQASRQDNGSSWWSRQTRQRLVVVFAVVALIALFLLAPGFLTATGGNNKGTASAAYQNIGLFAALGLILGFLIWLGRRK